MSWDIILDLIAKGEGQNLTILKGIESPTLLARHVSAFSNSSGGKIVIGLDNINGHLIGSPLSREWLVDVTQSYCSPPVEANITNIPRHDKNLWIIDIKEGDDKPYMVDDICYIREAKITRVAQSDEEKVIKGYVGDKNINARQKKALAYVQENTNITNRAYRDLFGISHKTAHIELTDMVAQDLLQVSGSGRSTSYIFTDREASTLDTPQQITVTASTETSAEINEVFQDNAGAIKTEHEEYPYVET